MAGSAILSIKILTDASKASQGMDQASTKVGRMQSALGKMAVPAAIAGAAVVAFGKNAVDAASRVQQSMGAVQTVFGKSAGQVERWAAGAADSVGLAKSEYGELASTLGASLKNMGVPMGQLAGQTNDLIKLGADLSATYGGTTKEAVEALGSALRGETDPIERYGISIKQATIEAEMARRGTDKLTGAAATQAKTQALLALVTKQSGKAVGAFAREADTAEGQAQRNAAAWENAQAAIGLAFLPAVTAASKALAAMGVWVEKNSKLAQILIVVIGGVAAAILAANVALKAYAVATEVVGVVSKATWLANPVFLVVAAVVALAVGIVVLYKKSKTFRDLVNKLWSTAKSVFGKIGDLARKAGDAIGDAWRHARDLAKTAAGVIRDVWRVLFAAIRGYLQAWRAYFALVFSVVKGIVKTVVAVMKGDWRGAFDAIRGIVAAFRDFFRSIFNLLPEPVQRVVEKIKTGLGGAFDWLTSKLSGLGSKLAAPFDLMTGAVQDVIDVVQDLIGWLGNIKVPDIGGKIGDLVGKLPLSVTVPPSTGATPASDPRLRATPRGPSSSSSSTGPSIVVQGALDPEAVARQIRRILTNHDRRVGTVSVA